MDSLNSLDELLDFDDDDDAKPSGGPPSGVSGPDDPSPPLPKTEEACEEEELEWLSNKDAFPAVEMETFVGIDILTGGIGNAKHQSPVSVLESSTTTTSTTIPTLMSSCGTLKAPHRARSKGRPRRGNSSFAGILGQQLLWNQGNSKDEETECETTEEEKKCQHCGATETPLWRQGPLGPKTLCNACGMRHRSGRLVPEYRPLRSPTFSRNLHSNFHKKIVEMKKKHHGKEMVVKPVDKGQSGEKKQLYQAHKYRRVKGTKAETMKMTVARKNEEGLCFLEFPEEELLNQTHKHSMVERTTVETMRATIASKNEEQGLAAPSVHSPLVEGTPIGRHCQNCGTHNTPRWWSGPLGMKTLCNACWDRTIRRKCQHCGTEKTSRWWAFGPESLCNACRVKHNSQMIKRKCLHCGTAETSRWWAIQAETLCNACGVKYNPEVIEIKCHRCRTEHSSHWCTIGENIPCDDCGVKSNYEFIE